MLLPPHQLQPASPPVVSAHPSVLPPLIPWYIFHPSGTTKSLPPQGTSQLLVSSSVLPAALWTASFPWTAQVWGHGRPRHPGWLSPTPEPGASRACEHAGMWAHGHVGMPAVLTVSVPRCTPTHPTAST